MKKLPLLLSLPLALLLLIVASEHKASPVRLLFDRLLSPSASSTYRAHSPEPGMNVFVWGYPNSTERDLDKVAALDFGWQKSLFQWRQIEGNEKGKYYWVEADRVVQASQAAGVRILARVDFQPAWSRADGARNGPPDDLRDYADFIYALVDRYKTGSPLGHIDALEIWNEPNTSIEWGGKPPDAAHYVEMLKQAYLAAKRADSSVTIVTAGLAPTATWDSQTEPDDVFLRQMYDAGAGSYFDVLGAHAPGYKAPPSMGPEEVASRRDYGGNRAFTFRRVEDLRKVMVQNGDSRKQIWLTEFGWTTDSVHPSFAWFRVTEDQKARYVVDAFRWAADHWSPWIGVMALWNLPDPSWTPSREEYWWSIANADGSDRPAYVALKSAFGKGRLSQTPGLSVAIR